VTTRIPLVDLGAQYFSMRNEVDAAIAEVVAETAFIGTASNRFVAAFEQQFAAYVGTRFCVASANGTDSLEILLRAAGIRPGDEVLVPALSWIATSEAVSTCGAVPVFVDVLPDLYSIDPDAAAAKVTSKTAAIIPVHLYGLPACMDRICGLAERHGLFLLEDCAQAHGATYRGRKVGTFGNAASYSFFPGKNLGAWGDAGAMLTDDEQLARKARMIAQHGQSAQRHDHQIEGRNSRMDGIQAAILSAKLKHLDEWTTSRRTIAKRFREALGGVVSAVQATPEDSEGVYHLFVVELENRESVQSALAARGISTGIHYPHPLPLLPAYARFGHAPEEFPVASAVSSRILSLPLYPEMNNEQQLAVISAVSAALERPKEHKPEEIAFNVHTIGPSARV